ncbi:MAG: DUF2789 domain-containing protein [Porticoccaceae bacterium]|jgi:hypothetical protein|nr:DUF2789 domain-containing protein [Porticoccaceae bacterium]
MEIFNHDISNLFAQLGLDGDEETVERFIASHRHGDPRLSVDQLAVWTPSQKQFLREALAEDSAWCEAVDELSARLCADTAGA